MFVRPGRSATIRTRLSLDQIREQLGVIAQEPGPEGTQRLLADGYFRGGRVGTRDFQIDYLFNSHQNPQTYGVYGTFAETPDWRFVRLKLRADSPWITGWSLAALLALLGLKVAFDELSPGAALAALAFVVAISAFANLLFIPDKVTDRVSILLARELRGSVRQGRNWVVPRD